MFTAMVIAFREVFEMAIIICVVLAATRQVAKRSLWIGGGIALGTAVVAVMTYFASAIVDLASHLDQHVFHAIVLMIASVLIGWSVVWMQKHGRDIATQMRAVSQSIHQGQTPLYTLAIVVGLAVLREGSEIVLFLYGVFASGQASSSEIIVGGLLGVALGMLSGVVMYLGLIRLPVKQLFSVSAWLLAFLAAGMAAKAAGHLVAADVLPALVNPMWDTSAILSQRSLFGRFLSVLVGYQDHPSGVQVLCYVITLALITMTLIPKRRAPSVSRP
jgi:high-affinity iron transporter